MIPLGSFGQGGQQGRIDPHRDYLPGSVAGRLSAKLAESIDVVPTLGFVGPVIGG